MKMSGGALRQRSRGRKWAAVLAALAVGLVTVGIVPIAVQSAAADVPPTPIAAPFDAPMCENTTGNPAVDADGGPVTNLLSVFGQRLTNYNNGDPVILYNNNGRSGWTSGGSQYFGFGTPICVTQYSADAGTAVSAWSYCTYDRASGCAWTNANGELERSGTVLPPIQEVAPDSRLTADQRKIQAYIVQNDLPIAAGTDGEGGTTVAMTANNDTASSRKMRGKLVHCIDNPTRSGTGWLDFCANNMGPDLQAQILAKVNATPATQLGATSPSAPLLSGETGEIELTTTITTPLTLTVTGGTVTVCDGPATLAGNTLVVDDDATLPASVTLCATRPDAGTVSVSVSGLPPVTTNAAYFQSSRFAGDTLCQIFAVYSDEQPDAVTTSGSVVFAEDEVVPVIGTTLVDQADGDKYITQAGGTVVDTIAYEGLQPSTLYTVSGELYNKADGTATGITATQTFTSSASGNGTVDVTFTIPASWAGATLVAFETVSLGNTEVASHEDIDDEAQTVYIADLGTTLIDSSDGDKNVSTLGGIVLDTVEYTNLVPNTAYTVSGELYEKATGTATGITGIAPFTSSATGSGTVDVSFQIDDTWAGRTLVAFETVTRNGLEIATHEDIDDAAQTVVVDEAPEIGTLALTDNADNNKILPLTGGTITDTVSYSNLPIGECFDDGAGGLECLAQYYVTGELMFVDADGTVTATGITGTTEPNYFQVEDASQQSGTVDVTFTVTAAQAEQYSGGSLVVFEQMSRWYYGFGVPVVQDVASHEDAEDADQTVTVESRVPLIGTTLADELDGDKYIAQNGGTVIDTVSYSGLEPNTDYTVSGELYDQETGTATGIIGSTTFTSPDSGTGTVEVEFTITDEWAGRTLTAFEFLTLDGDEVASHEDINDAAQTVYVADLGTTLVDQADGDKNVASAGGTVVDTVEYANLKPNTSYTVSGELYDKATGAATGIIGTADFVSSATGNGTVEVEFTINGDWAGATLVAFETVTEAGVTIAVHEDINDGAQTVTVGNAPLIGTTLADELDGDKYIVQTGGTVIDTVAYENLEPNTEYTVSGELWDRETGEATGITGSTTFTSSDSGTGTVEVEFTITDEWAGHTLTAFEVLTLDDDTVATHEDINDDAQTVYIADLGTTLVDAADGDKSVAYDGGTVIDTVAYENLAPNTEYTVSGELFDKATGESTGITGSATFTSSATGTGTVEVEFVIDGDWAGTTLVAFETVTQGDLVIAVHEDINDTAQTVIVGNTPRIGTTLADELDGDKYIVQTGGTVVDTVAYENLEPNTEYTVTGELHDQKTGEATGITGSATFTSSATGTGSVEVVFEIPAGWAGHTLTAFEVLTLGENTIATHEDINDAAQTVYVADIGTTLVDRADGDKNVAASGGVVIDTVAYTNLAPNTEYTVSGELYDKATGTATGITGSTTFTSSTTGSGSVEVGFVINGNWAGHTLVAFEVVTLGQLEVAVHEDINDAGQTVTVDRPGIVPGLAVTGLGGQWVWFAGAGAAALLAGAALLLIRRRQNA